MCPSSNSSLARGKLENMALVGLDWCPRGREVGWARALEKNAEVVPGECLCHPLLALPLLHFGPEL